VGTAFGCTLQGEVRPAEVLRLLQALLDAGADRVSLADTVGYADPAAVSRLFEQAAARGRRALLVRPLPRHARAGAGQCHAALQLGVPLRCLAGRHRRLPACARRQRQRASQTWPSCSKPWAWPPASIWPGCWPARAGGRLAGG
jgi:hypothetical protein